MKRIAFLTEGVLQVFIGVGAVASGALLVIAPDGRAMQMPLDMLSGSPFGSFLIPGLILFLVHGVGNIVSAILCFRMRRIAAFSGMLFGFALIIWIYVQVTMIGGGHWLQYLYFVFGLVLVILGVAMRELERNQG
jgi:hypothetical protein